MHKIKKHKRALFWKIFGLVWLSNLSIVVAAALLIVLDLEKERHQLLSERRIERSAMPLIREYERTGNTMVEFKRAGRFIELIDVDKQETVFGAIPAKHQNKLLSFTIEAHSGRNYRINYVPLPNNQQSWVVAKSYFSVLRVLSSLIIISIFSALITALVTRPIRQLRQHIKQLSTGDLDTRIDSKLTGRNDEIGHLAESINQMSDRIEQLIHDKQQLLYDVSHELKAPLARMQVANAIAYDLTENKGLPTKHHTQVDKDIVHLTNMIDELLSLARIEHAPDSNNTSEFTVTAFLQQEIDNLNYTWPDRAISLHCPDGTIISDSKLLSTAISNILVNALKHSNSDIAIKVQQSETHWQIAIEDLGEGVQPEQLPNLFRPFVRGNTQAKGFGLGLAITAKAVNRIGGEISARANQPHGLIVEITLPIAIA